MSLLRMRELLLTRLAYDGQCVADAREKGDPVDIAWCEGSQSSTELILDEVNALLTEES